MQVRQKKSNKKKIIVITLIILILAGGIFAYVYSIEPSTSKNSTSSEQLPKDNNSLVDKDSESLEVVSDSQDGATTQEPTKVEDKTPVQYEGEETDDTSVTGNERFRIPEGE